MNCFLGLGTFKPRLGVFSFLYWIARCAWCFSFVKLRWFLCLACLISTWKWTHLEGRAKLSSSSVLWFHAQQILSLILLFTVKVKAFAQNPRVSQPPWSADSSYRPQSQVVTSPLTADMSKRSETNLKIDFELCRKTTYIDNCFIHSGIWFIT